MEAGESANVAMQASGPDTKLLVAGVIEVSFKSPVKVCVEGATVQAPHWKLGDRVNDGPWSKRPAAYLVDGASGATKDVEVKVKIKKAQNVSGNAKLVGELSGLRITGDCPLS